ncbi:MAG: ParB/RepB/Spo0J family partition protein [Clostridiales bacterium]|nr:ParB/RepB/Spo0J family partition protein [Clostridiales bacterium]
MARKPGLGRGLDALFADVAPVSEEEYIQDDRQLIDESNATEILTAATNVKGEKKASTSEVQEKDRVLYIDINDIKPNSAQPRVNFDESKLNELAESIRINGVIQPLIVRRGKNGYEIVAGERRWRASRIAGLKKVPCITRDFDDRQNAIVAIIENMQREDLDPIEEAMGLRSMTEKYGFTQEQISSSLGRSRTYIANSMRLLKLPKEIQQYVSSGQMSAAHGRTIINITDADKQREIAEKIIRKDLSVRATEKLADKIKDELKPDRKKRSKKEENSKTDDVLAVEAELRRLLGTKVNIISENNKGKIEIEYYSIDELNRLIDILRDFAK